MRTGSRVGAIAMVVLAGCSGAGPESAAPPTISVPTPPSTTATAVEAADPKGAHKLTAFASCSSLLGHYKREAMRTVTPYGLTSAMYKTLVGDRTMAMESLGADSRAGSQVVTGSAASTGGSAPGLAAGDTGSVGGGGGGGYSRTNVQEEGVDEPDLVKSDGRRLVTLARGRLTVVDIAAPSPRLLGTLDLGTQDAPSELLLVGDRVVVLGHRWGQPVALDSVGDSVSTHMAPLRTPESTVRVVDIADPAAPTSVATVRLEGRYVSARLAADVVRLVVTQDPKGPAFSVPKNPGDEVRTLEENRDAIRKSTVKDWLPTYTVEQPGKPAATAPLAPCSAVLRPQEFSGFGTVSVLTLDPADPDKPGNPACVLGGGHLVYAGPENLYVATEQWKEGAVPTSSTMSTQLHRFAIPGRQPAAYVASGEIAGSVLNQFSMSELDGRLRVASTVRSQDGKTESFVFVLEAQDGRLVTVGSLGNLGHEGETIQSVRFIGTRGYVVTFRQTDPLYVIDLQDPRRPQLRGELQIPGFSSYLHPLSESVLLGVGQGPGDRGGQGLQLSLFDVRDPAHPVRTDNKVFEYSSSSAQGDHHAFLWWAPAGRLVLPFQEHEGGRPFAGAIVVDVDPAKGFGAVNRLTHEDRAGRNGYDWTIHRALVVGPQLLTLSESGLLTNDLGTLAERAWLNW